MAFEVSRERIGILGELWAFMKVRKKWWLGPIVVTMLLLSVLTRDVRTAWTAVAWRRRGRPVEEIARALRRPPAVIETLTGSASVSETRFAWKLRRCWDAERRLKSSGEPGAEMAALVADLCAER